VAFGANAAADDSGFARTGYAEAEDPLESVSGTNGLTGAADTIMVLNRTADGPKLYGRGRDIEEIEKALRFDKGTWEVLGNADDVKRSEQRRRIIEVLTDATTALTPTFLATTQTECCDCAIAHRRRNCVLTWANAQRWRMLPTQLSTIVVWIWM
jgi:hypothetical protein